MTYRYDNLMRGFMNELWNPRDKLRTLEYHVRYMLARTQQIFRYTGLPDTIPARILELYLQVNGYAGIFRHNGELYCAFGSLGGEPDYNYMPTVFTVSNPALNYSANLKINEDCCIIRSDSMYTGLLPVFRRYGSALAENELSMNIASINTRILSLISASDDRTKESAELFLKHVIDGDIGVIGELAMMENLKTLPYAVASAQNQIKNLIEYEQYLKASEFNEIGLDANYNMKRETLTDSENEMNRDSLFPLIDDMLKSRREGIEAVNNMFGTNITVSLNSAWEDNAEELELNHEIMEQETERIQDQEETEDAAETE